MPMWVPDETDWHRCSTADAAALFETRPMLIMGLPIVGSLTTG